MMWAGVSLHHITNIVFMKGNWTAARYQHEVLDTEVIPLLRNHGGMQLLHDGAPVHLARAKTAYLNAKNVYVVYFSPQITRIKHKWNIWDELNRRVRRTEAIPTTLNQLRAKVLYKWNSLLQNYVQRYVVSMRCRCLVVVNSAGDISATKFT